MLSASSISFEKSISITARFRVGTSLYILARTSSLSLDLFLKRRLLLDTAGEKGSFY